MAGDRDCFGFNISDSTMHPELDINDTDNYANFLIVI